MNSWNGKFHIGSLYECTSNLIVSVLLVSQASSFIMVHLDSRSPWNETPYGKICGHQYSLSSPGVACKKRGQLEWSYFSKDLDSFCSLMNIFLRNLGHFLPVSSSSAWAVGYGPTLSEIPYSCRLRVLAISQSDLFSPNLFPKIHYLWQH